MARTETKIADSTYTAQETIIGPVPIAKALRAGGLEIDRAGFTNPADSLSVRAEFSVNGGVSWQLWCGFTVKGSSDTTDPAQVGVGKGLPRNSTVRVRIQTNGISIKQALRLVEVD